MGLGKRKQRDEIDSGNALADTSEADDLADLQARFQQHFEANFEPLENKPLPVKHIRHSEDHVELSDSDWSGLSDGEDMEGPQVIQHQRSKSGDTEIPKDELNSFMACNQTAKPPSRRPAPTSKRKTVEPQNPDDVASDAANLKKDLALQRLLKESHLLDSQSALSVSGRNRHKAVDMRLQDLGSKTSIYAQEKMPMSHRKGIIAKSAEREEARRKEAYENGIILEKATKMKKGSEARRQRSIGAPTVGKFQGGILKLSKKDVVDIQGPKKSVKRKR